MSAANDPAFLIRTAHTYDRRLSVPTMLSRLRALRSTDVLSAPCFDELSSQLITAPPLVKPMTYVAALIAQDVRFLNMRHLDAVFYETILGNLTPEPCGCIAGHTLSLAQFLYWRQPTTTSDVVRRLVTYDWPVLADTILAASGHTCAAAGDINYFSSDLDGRRQVNAMATLEAAAVAAKTSA